MCPNLKESSDGKEPASKSKKRAKNSGGCDTPNESDEPTKHANVAAALPDDLERIGACFLV